MGSQHCVLDVIFSGEPLDPIRVAEDSEITIGRGSESDLVLDDPHLSRRHLRIVRSPNGELRAYDLGSKNRTELNGKPMADSLLEAGDVLTVGQCSIVVRGVHIGSTSASAEDQGSQVTRLLEIDPRDTAAFVSPDEPLAAGPLRLESVYRFTQGMVGIDSEAELLEHLDRALRDGLDFDRYFFGRGDPSDDRFEIVRAGEAVPSAGGDSIRMSETILYEIQRSRCAILAEEADYNGTDHAASVRELGISSFMCSPLVIGECFLGLIYVDRRGELGGFDETDLKYLQGLAHVAALALDDLENRQRIERENDVLRTALRHRENFIADSPRMLEVMDLVRRFSDSDSPVLVLGETGTGKEHIARMVHDASARRAGPFVPFNCALSSPALIESELFGHTKGAFTDASRDRKGRFELADGGSLFLDEIGEMSIDLQAKLLRVLQEKRVWPVGAERPIPVDVRLISATHRNLKARRKEGLFRDDLYYRIGVLTIEIPRLSRRDDDILAIAESVLPEGYSMSADVRSALLAYAWPGNVRELQNVIEQACLRADRKVLRLADLPFEIAREGRREPVKSSLISLRDMEAKLIARTLAALDGNKRRAAEVLEISRNTLYQKLRQYGL